MIPANHQATLDRLIGIASERRDVTMASTLLMSAAATILQRKFGDGLALTIMLESIEAAQKAWAEANGQRDGELAK